MGVRGYKMAASSHRLIFGVGAETRAREVRMNGREVERTCVVAGVKK